MSRLARIAVAAGRFQHLRGKGAFWVELVRTWIMPGAAIGAYALYLGLPKWVSVTVAVSVPILVEITGTRIARFLYDHGGQQEDYEMAMRKDPFKMKSLRLMRRQVRLLQRLLAR